MYKLKILLDTIDKIKDFVTTACSVPCEITLESGKYRVDGKSIMGVFSLDTTHEIWLSVNSDYVVYFRKWAVEQVTE